MLIHRKIAVTLKNINAIYYKVRLSFVTDGKTKSTPQLTPLQMNI